MLIDSFDAQWLAELTTSHRTSPDGARLLLLIDGVFVPGLFRKLSARAQPVLLFESLPGCSENTRDVSPFVVEFDPLDQSLLGLLDTCNGWPMVSAIVTYEGVEQLSERLAVWCVVEVDDQRFNFRFPDTRRLPGIFSAMTQQQRREFSGTALGWHYIDRNGAWRALTLEPVPQVPPISEKARLNNFQFGPLLKDSEADEVWVRLQYRGVQSALLPSQRHALLMNALSVLENDNLEELQRIRWCGHCLKSPADHDSSNLQARFKEWAQKNVRKEDEALSRVA